MPSTRGVSVPVRGQPGASEYGFSKAGRPGFQYDPVRGLERLLAQDLPLSDCFPRRSMGLDDLLTQSCLPCIGDGDAKPPSEAFLFRIEHWLRNPSLCTRSAIRVHKDEKSLVNNILSVNALCVPEFLMGPNTPRVVVASIDERVRYEFLLDLDPEFVLKSFPLGASPIVLADEIPRGAKWDEVFLAPGCRDLAPGELLTAVKAAIYGLHVVQFRSGSTQDI